MKRKIALLGLCLFLFSCGNNNAKIEFFTHDGCPYCDKALTFIKAAYPTVPMEILEVGKPENMKRFMACAERFKLNKRTLGTPLICMGDNYILGWSEDDKIKFKDYVVPYLKK